MENFPNYNPNVLEDMRSMKPYEYSFTFFFERWAFGAEDLMLRWTKKNQYLTILVPTLYLILLRCGMRYMKHREAFDLRMPLIIWSAILAVFSTLGAVRVVPNVLFIIREYGLRPSMCLPVMSKGVPAFWAAIFVYSKIYELGDTFFIVFRKQRLIFLHWYHHITVLMYSWWCYQDQDIPAYWYFSMNFTVHAFMYTYYTLRAMRIQMPKWVAISITTLQIAQMVIGMSTYVLYAWYRMSGQFCHVKLSAIVCGVVMYSSYFFLFVEFFYSTYIKKKHAKHVNHQPNGDTKKVQ